MSGLSESERLHLARAVYAVTGHRPPRDESDLSMVRDEIETAVEQFIAAYVAAALNAKADEIEAKADASLVHAGRYFGLKIAARIVRAHNT